MGEQTVKDGHLKKLLGTRVSLEIHKEANRRAIAKRRTVSVYLEMLLEKYFSENPEDSF